MSLASAAAPTVEHGFTDGPVTLLHLFACACAGVVSPGGVGGGGRVIIGVVPLACFNRKLLQEKVFNTERT